MRGNGNEGSRSRLVLGILLMSASLLACANSPAEPAAGIEVARSTLTLNQANVFGFEDRTQWQSSAALSSSATHTQGSISLGVQARGYIEVTSLALPSLTGVTG